MNVAEIFKLSICGLFVLTGFVCAGKDVKRETYRETETDVEAREIGKPSAGAATLKIVEGPDWVPFTYFKNIEAGSALDFSGQLHLDRPAGKHGRVIVKDGHFAFADSPEVARHFWGCNINGEAMCPDHDLAVEVAERLARTGYARPHPPLRFAHHRSGKRPHRAGFRPDGEVRFLCRRTGEARHLP